MVEKCQVFIYILCFLVVFSCETHQQGKHIGNKFHSVSEKGNSTSREGSNWKAIAIVILGVLVLGAICYGTNCFYVFQMTLCERTEKNYTKMDLTSQV